ncbi:MAG: endonuclease domain-containing protein [Bacteroidota bacterium]
MADKDQYHHYNPNLKTFARQLRRNSTKAEIRTWKELLRAKKMMGYAFLRQRPILNYIADFYCKDLKLVVEIDGFTHETIEAIEKDKIRDATLRVAGYKTIRFTNYEVLNELEDVKLKLEKYICEIKETSP